MAGVVNTSVLLDPVTCIGKDYVKSNYNRYINTENMLEIVKRLLPHVKDAIKKAEERSFLNDLGRNEWLVKIKGLETKAMEVLDDFESSDIREKLNKGKLIKSATSFCKKLKMVVFSDEKLKRLENIALKLQGADSDVQKYIKKSQTSTNIGINKNEGYIGNRVVFGRDTEVKEIINILRNYSFTGETNGNLQITTQKRVLVLPIVGVMGIGKTTLAQVIYDDEFVRKSFGFRKWVDCSYDISHPAKLIHGIIYCFGGEKSNYQDNNLRTALYDLREILKNKKFFLVLDGVWEYVHDKTWSEIKNVLAEGAAGSVVIVTTQFRSVGDAIKTVRPITLDVMKWDDFWNIFNHHVFGNTEWHDNEKNKKILVNDLLELETVKMEIAKALNGTPLEAEMIGKFLNKTGLNADEWVDPRKRANEWDEISRNGWWYGQGTSKYITPILQASFRNLNMKEKRSFLYASIFPKGYAFEKDQLINMWIALGLVEANARDEERREMEKEASDRLDSLTNRFYFVKNPESRYVMNKLIRDLVVCVFNEEFANHNKSGKNFPKFACYLASKSQLVTQLGETKNELLQSLVLLGDKNEKMSSDLRIAFRKSVRTLRLLDLSNIMMGTEEFPDIFAKVPYLRYLDLSFTMIDSLPESICSLYFLETLNLRGCEFQLLPKKLNNLINLHHLYASVETVSLIDRIGKLTNLLELKEFSVKPEKGHKINELMNMNKIMGKLIISNLEYVHKKEDARDSNLKDKNDLNCLVLKWNKKGEVRNTNCIRKVKFDCLTMKGHKEEDQFMEIVEELKPHSGLKEMEFINYPGTCLPKWISEETKSSRLRHVEIVGGSLEVLPPLGEMIFLKILILENLKLKKIESEFYGSSEEVFPLLGELSLIKMEELEEWNVIEGREMFPHLQKLKISSCPALKSLPNNLPRSLKELQIENCSKELRKRYARDGGQDWSKISHVPSITITHDTT